MEQRAQLDNTANNKDLLLSNEVGNLTTENTEYTEGKKGGIKTTGSKQGITNLKFKI